MAVAVLEVEPHSLAAALEHPMRALSTLVDEPERQRNPACEERGQIPFLSRAAKRPHRASATGKLIPTCLALCAVACRHTATLFGNDHVRAQVERALGSA